MVEEILADSRVADVYREVERKLLHEGRVSEVQAKGVVMNPSGGAPGRFRAVMSRLLPGAIRS